VHENPKNHTLEVEVKCFAYIRCWCKWAWICWSVDISKFSNKTFTRCESCQGQVAKSKNCTMKVHAQTRIDMATTTLNKINNLEEQNAMVLIDDLFLKMPQESFRLWKQEKLSKIKMWLQIDAIPKVVS